MSLKSFYQDPYLHIRSFVINLLFSAMLCWLAYSFHSPDFYSFSLQGWELLLIPLGIYAGGISAVAIHNASHGSFPAPWLNRLCGHIAGMHQLWGYFGWKFIHMLHHQYSDRDGADPHPPKGLSFAAFTRRMFWDSSAQVTKRYREHWGMTRRTAALRMCVYISFTAMAAVNALFWYLLLGTEGFVFFYLPSYVFNYVFFAHINYYAHPETSQDGRTAPANFMNGWYYKAANWFFFGIYYHENHHRDPTLFNPSRLQPQRVRSAKSFALDSKTG